MYYALRSRRGQGKKWVTRLRKLSLQRLRAGNDIYRYMAFYYTYVLKCLVDSHASNFYIGYTSDLTKRLSLHKNKEITSTKKYASVELIYYEACRSKVDAISREKALKTGYGRAFLKNRLKSDLLRV